MRHRIRSWNRLPGQLAWRTLACLVLASVCPAWAQMPAAMEAATPSATESVARAVGSRYFGDLDFSNQAALDSPTPKRFQPVIGLEMGVIALFRSEPEPQILAFDQDANVLLDASQLQGDPGAGLDATLNFFNLFSDCHAVDIQMRYFQTGEMGATETISSNPVLPIFFNGTAAEPVDSYDFITTSLARSFESNLVVRTPYRLRFLAGFRHFELDEIYNVIDLEDSSDTQIAGFFSLAENTMGGGQVGAEGSLWSNRYSRLFGSFKWGLLNNDIVGSARATNPAGGDLQADTFDSVTSQLLDFQLGGSLAINRWLSFYGGYQGLILSDVALALTQSENGRVVINSNPVFYRDTQLHGFKLTAMATW